MSHHIHLDLAEDTPPDKLVVLAKYCLQRAGVLDDAPAALAKARGTVRRRQRSQPPPPTTFADPALDVLWRHVGPWGTHWWIEVAPLLDTLLAEGHGQDAEENWRLVAHVLHLAGQAFQAHITGLMPHAPHADLQRFWQDHLLPPHVENGIEQACLAGMDQQARSQLDKARPLRDALTAIEQAAIRYAQRAAGAVLQPILAGVQARVMRRVLQEERQALQQRVPDAIAQRQSPRRLASLLAADIGDWQRDLERVARTELAEAYNHGAMATLIAQHPSNQVRHPDGTLHPVAQSVPPPVHIFRTPAHTACDHCRDLYVNTDGTPHLYALQEVLSNPSNYGLLAHQWTAQVGVTHPNCLCSSWQTYIPALHGPLFASMSQEGSGRR